MLNCSMTAVTLENGFSEIYENPTQIFFLSRTKYLDEHITEPPFHLIRYTELCNLITLLHIQPCTVDSLSPSWVGLGVPNPKEGNTFGLRVFGSGGKILNRVLQCFLNWR